MLLFSTQPHLQIPCYALNSVFPCHHTQLFRFPSQDTNILPLTMLPISLYFPVTKSAPIPGSGSCTRPPLPAGLPSPDHTPLAHHAPSTHASTTKSWRQKLPRCVLPAVLFCGQFNLQHSALQRAFLGSHGPPCSPATHHTSHLLSPFAWGNTAERRGEERPKKMKEGANSHGWPLLTCKLTRNVSIHSRRQSTKISCKWVLLA